MFHREKSWAILGQKENLATLKKIHGEIFNVINCIQKMVEVIYDIKLAVKCKSMLYFYTESLFLNEKKDTSKIVIRILVNSYNILTVVASSHCREIFRKAVNSRDINDLTLNYIVVFSTKDRSAYTLINFILIYTKLKLIVSKVDVN